MAEPPIPPELPLAERLLRVNFLERRARDAAGVPRVTPEFVAEAGRSLYVIDVREPDELNGPFGHVPGSVPVPLDTLADLAKRLGRDAPVAVVSNHGDRAGRAAGYLELLGMRFVAAMDGGVAAWKALGLGTSRDPATFARLDAAPAPPSAAPDAPLTRDRVEAHIARMGSVRWIKLAAFLLRGRRSCVDGRDDHAVIGVPGGDMGEFVLALAAYEDLAGQRLDAAQVARLMAAYVDTFGRVYYHNDTHTAGRVIAALRADPRLTEALRPLDTPMDWRGFLRAPPAELREPLLEHYLQVGSIGCGHLRLMMQHPDRFGLRAELVRDAIGAFWRTRWRGFSELEYVILGGAHGERAVLQITVEDRLWPFLRVPLVSPSIDGTQAFIFHSQVAAHQRENLADWLLREEGALPTVPSSREALVEAVVRHGHHQRETTLDFLAAGLPRFEVRFSGTDRFAVLG